MTSLLLNGVSGIGPLKFGDGARAMASSVVVMTFVTVSPEDHSNLEVYISRRPMGLKFICKASSNALLYD